MTLRPGDRIGPYEILAAIGAGGMGEVYRGRDTRLDRTVAIKVLPDAVANDEARLARFEREAKTLAALNHPNVAQIYGLEGRALVMEFVDGEDLSARLAGGAMPVDDILPIAAQIADALEAAHEFGIVHRDLKPSNIRLRADDTIKVLDFGLAKALAAPASLLDTPSRPTVTSPAMTELGAILGTAAYMAPEQARGKTADKRADIWAFGVVLYEMSTGRRPFDGETATDAIAAVMKESPDWTPVPQKLRRLLQSCLEKDPKKRLRDVGDWRRQLDGVSETAAPPPPSRWPLWSAIGALAAALAVVTLLHFGEPAAAPVPVMFQVPAPSGATLEGGFGVSSDGRRLAFIARGNDEVSRLWIRDVGALEARPVAGAEGARSVLWSADDRQLVFTAGATLKRVAADGGPVLTIVTAGSPEAIGAGALTRDGVVVFGGYRATGVPIRRVAETGGPVTPLTNVDPTRKEVVHGIPFMLPDGRHFLYTRVATDEATAGVFIGSIDRRPEEQDLTRLVAASNAVYAGDSRRGHVLYLRQGILMAHRFDVQQLKLLGDPVPVADGVGNVGSYGYFSASAHALAYRAGPRAAGVRGSQLTWVGRDGKAMGTVGPPASYDGLSLSPDDRRAAAVQVGSADVGLGNIDLWIVDLVRGVSQRLTSDPAADRSPVWSPDGNRIIFYSTRNGPTDLFVTRSDGSGAETLLFKSGTGKIPTSWSSDGNMLFFQAPDGMKSNGIWMLPLKGDLEPIPILRTQFQEVDARLSPNGRLLAYTSNQNSRQEVWVRPFNAASPQSDVAGVPISGPSGGRIPRWRKDGREIVYLGGDGRLWSVQFSPGPPIQPRAARPLFAVSPGVPWDAAQDLDKFLIAMPLTESGQTAITLRLNWTRDGRR